MQNQLNKIVESKHDLQALEVKQLREELRAKELESVLQPEQVVNHQEPVVKSKFKE